MVLVSSAVTGDLIACGDRFLVPSRGLRFELRPATRQQAAVLFYVNPASDLGTLFTKLSVDPAVRKAGYRPTLVTNTGELTRALTETAWDVVLIDLGDNSTVELPSAKGLPMLVGVTLDSKSTNPARAKQHYAAVLKSPTRSQAFVDALDEAVTKQRSARAKTVKAS